MNLKQRAYIFALKIIQTVRTLSLKDIAVQVTAKQIVRSATSIGANVVEAHGGSTKRDFINFFHHALKSANETKFWLCLMRDLGILQRVVATKFLQECSEIAKMLGASLTTLKKNAKIKLQ